MENSDMISEVKAIRDFLGSQVTIAAHHYQHPDIIACADIVGDSYGLAVSTASSSAAYIIFCGVQFMAESARVLAKPGQHVLLPRLDAGCPMADMITRRQAAAVLQLIEDITGAAPVPVVYMNSSSEAKSLAGERGGSVCTSSNAVKVVREYLEEGRSIFFFPDQHLGRHTAKMLHMAPQSTAMVSSDFSLACQGDEKLARMFLYDGWCEVHQHFLPEDVAAFRTRHPESTVMVHPECMEEVALMADMIGSTDHILRAVSSAPAGSVIGIGTESTFVHRLASEHPDKIIVPLRESPCEDMCRTSLSNLLSTLREVLDHHDRGIPLRREVTVDDKVARGARRALETMIQITDGVKL